MEVNVLELKEQLDSKEITLLDVREDYELKICHIKNSKHILMNQIPNNLDLLEKKKELIVDFFSNYPGEIKNPNSFFMSANNQFNVLYRMKNTDDKSFSFLKKVWPPVLGKNKEKFLNIMKYWTKSSIEDALLILKKAELRTRKNSKLSNKKVISFAFLEICLLNK